MPTHTFESLESPSTAPVKGPAFETALVLDNSSLVPAKLTPENSAFRYAPGRLAVSIKRGAEGEDACFAHQVCGGSGGKCFRVEVKAINLAGPVWRAIGLSLTVHRVPVINAGPSIREVAPSIGVHA